MLRLDSKMLGIQPNQENAGSVERKLFSALTFAFVSPMFPARSFTSRILLFRGDFGFSVWRVQWLPQPASRRSGP
jgi:nitrate reductase NapE component